MRNAVMNRISGLGLERKARSVISKVKKVF